MEAGKYDRWIEIERYTTTKNPLGGETKTWENLTSVWASYWPISDGEKWRAEQVSEVATARFRIRYDGPVADVNITGKDRIVFEGDVFEINGVKEIGRKVDIELTATLIA